MCHHWARQLHPLTFPCISIRSVRVMLSSGSSSSPASELLILSGGAGATVAWECVHAVAQLALDRAAEKSLRGALVTLPLLLHGDPRARPPKLKEKGIAWALSSKCPSDQYIWVHLLG